MVFKFGDGFSSPILDENGTLYVAGAKGFGLADVYAIYATGNAAGSQKWTLRLFSDCSLIMSPTLLYTNATLYVGTSYMCGSTQKGDVCAIYTTGSAAGTLKWKFPFGSPVQSPPIFVGRGVQSSPILDANGTLYVGSRDGNVYAIYTTGSAAGTLKWTFPTGSPVQSSMILDANGTLYVGSNDGNVYAMYTGMNCSCSAGAHLSSAPFTDCSSLSTSCSPCGIGFYCPYIRAYGFALQVPCPLGTFCNSRGLSAAPLCPSGTYNC
jgi:outer membrane protein assembly factor BamB